MRDRATLIKRDRKGRVFMDGGPLLWWIFGFALVVAAGAAPIGVMSAHDPARRWVGVVYAVVLIGYCILFWRAFRSRMSAYHAELAREGLTHGQRTP